MTMYISECSNLPATWFGVRTDTMFYVKYGTEITVKCSEGHINMGDDVVTCSGGTNYKYSTEPTCTPGTY